MNPKYNELIDEVRKVDPEAADYLLYKAPRLDGFDSEVNLNGCFLWGETPQGHSYWKRIYYKIP